jgi:hypothetical protein
MRKKHPKKPGVKPHVITPEVLEKLKSAWAYGCTDVEGCLFAGIAPASLYNYQKKNPGYLEMKEMLKSKPFLKARLTVVNSLGQTDSAWKYLERKGGREFAPPTRSEITGADGGPLVVSRGPDMTSLDGGILEQFVESVNRATDMIEAKGQACLPKGT